MCALHTLTSRSKVQILPMENYSGRALIEQSGDLCERKTGHGVDPNRNWAVDWGKREKDYREYEEAAGVAPFSEPETAILRDVATAFAPDIWIAVHSGAVPEPLLLRISGLFSAPSTV